MPLPLAASPVEAGFPSPAEDFMDGTLDLNKYLIRNRPATFFAVVHGLSMVGEGIDEGDLLVIDKSIEPYDGCLAVCFLDGEFTLKRFKRTKTGAFLMPANPKFKPIPVTVEDDFLIWGVVTHLIKKV